MTEIRFTETNGVRCWRCCPLPLVASGLCKCECHYRKQRCGARLNSTAADAHCSRWAVGASRYCRQHGGRPTPKAVTK